MDETKPKKPVGRPYKDKQAGKRLVLNAKVAPETKQKLNLWRLKHDMSQGEVVDALPYETQGVLRAVVHGVDGGNTPYVRWVVRWGLWPLVLGVLALAVWAVSISRHSRNGPRRFRS